jgi:hypothetical protein
MEERNMERIFNRFVSASRRKKRAEIKIYLDALNNLVSYLLAIAWRVCPS